MSSTDLSKWADPAMYEAEPMKEARPRVTLLSATPDPLGAIGAACAMYEGRVIRNLAELTDDDRRRYWEQVKKTHLKAPLEFVDLHFMIEGVSRSFTHQMVRQRTAVYAQESLRFAVKENLKEEISVPPSLMRDFDADPEAGHPEIDAERATWDQTIEQVGEAYNALIDMGVPAEDARGLLPHSVTTRLNYKTNLRNLLEHAGNRLCTQAQFEWRFVFAEIVNAMRSYGAITYHSGDSGSGAGGRAIRSASWQWEMIVDTDLFRPVCFALGHCPFQADFDRGCTIRERMDNGRQDEVRDEEWLLDPAAARRTR